jgi:hypothetical protein
MSLAEQIASSALRPRAYVEASSDLVEEAERTEWVGMRLAIISPRDEVIFATQRSELAVQVAASLKLERTSRWRPRLRRRVQAAVEEAVNEFFLSVARL